MLELVCGISVGGLAHHRRKFDMQCRRTSTMAYRDMFTAGFLLFGHGTTRYSDMVSFS